MMAPGQSKHQAPSARTRRASTSQPQDFVADAEESKRVANRLAQRKFRRQRKDYITHLENELALCRAGAGDELVYRRQEVAKLHEEKAELRELLEHVARNLSRICGVEIAIGQEATQNQPDAPLGHLTPSQTESHNGDDQSSRNHPKTNQNHSSGIQGTSVDGNPGESIGGPDQIESIGTAKRTTASILEADLEMINEESHMQVDSGADFPVQHLQASVTGLETLQNKLPVDLSVVWSHEPYQSDERCSSWAQDQDQDHGDRARNSVSLQQIEDSHFLSSTSFEKLMSGFVDFLQAAPSTLTNICSSSGCNGQHNGSDKTNLMSMILRRQVDELVESYSGSTVDSLQSLQTLERNLVDSLIDIIVSLQATAAQLLGVRSLSMCGGSAWCIWQVVKTYWVLPRLADAGLLAAVSKFGFESDVFRDTMPAWMRQTDIQKTFEHNAAIDFIPWVRLREALIMHQDDVPIDDIYINLFTRGQPSGADIDRLVDLVAAAPWERIRRQFASGQDRLLRDSFYSSMSVWKLKDESNYGSGNCTTLLVDSLMAPGAAPVLFAS